MKYIYYLIVLFILFSISLAAYLYFNNSSDNNDSREFVLRVNGRNFTMEDLKERPHDLSTAQYAKTIIDKELLLQEAMRLKIHEEPHFKKSIKNFYEQSLITALMNKKNADFRTEAKEEEIAMLLEKMNSQVEIVIYFYKDYESAKKGIEIMSEKKSVIDFSDLSDSLKYQISLLSPDGKTAPLIDQSGYKVIKLEKVKNDGTSMPVDSSLKVMAGKIINAEKKKFLIETWQQELKNNAEIEIKGL